MLSVIINRHINGQIQDISQTLCVSCHTSMSCLQYPPERFRILGIAGKVVILAGSPAYRSQRILWALFAPQPSVQRVRISFFHCPRTPASYQEKVKLLRYVSDYIIAMKRRLTWMMSLKTTEYLPLSLYGARSCEWGWSLVFTINLPCTFGTQIMNLQQTWDWQQ